MKHRWILLGILISIVFIACTKTVRQNKAKDFIITFSGKAQIEAGGPYVGVEFHRSRIIPQRISFFYPVANSIDHSNDYWNRDTSFVMQWNLKIGDRPTESIGREPAEFELTPYSVMFQDATEIFSTTATYQFCNERPAMVLTIDITNKLDKTEIYQLDTRLKTSIKTCHTYRLIEKVTSEYDSETGAVYVKLNDADADSALIFIANAGLMPLFGEGTGEMARFSYQKQLKPGESLRIIQIIGSSKQAEGRNIVDFLLHNYQQEIEQYENQVQNKAMGESVFQTGDEAVDHSVAWAKAIMAANAHYLDGEIVPMPCPAEYNFYFTHDVLVTDLAMVNFDLARVKRDLDYIVRHADKDNIIPHAYYWKDGKYVTEYASSDNWNNFWLVQVSAKYLRHSGERKFVEKLYPFISKSVERSLLTLEDDNLMWSYRPDWWDIGHNYGPRSYMTILAIKTLRDYIYLSTALEKNPEVIQDYTILADKMQSALVEKLWNNNLNYLVNYHDDGSLDEHYYIGSLLAAHYGLLDSEKQSLLMQTATEKMFDDKVGVYNAFPMDFEKWGDFMKFAGNEAGAKYYYFNGGIWPQGNAWYAMALIANGEKAAAARFINNTMSLHGIMAGPNGQPAYYEVRNANKDDLSEYGTVDKPQFLWAGAWYINCLYQLYGIRENDWNIGIDPFLEENQKECEFTLYVDGKSLLISIEGKGNAIKEICYDDKIVPSAVFPENIPNIREVDIDLGKPKHPYLHSTDAILKSCQYNQSQLLLILKAFTGHNNKTIVISPLAPKQMTLNGEIYQKWVVMEHDDYKEIQIDIIHSSMECNLVLEF